ncbi:MGMT family protein [Clostridia bacterium OttesenSCG-928-O13]|nr:MGMT family protein [Clostridia bacterium OttesenSCG-928-O13]
MDAQFFERVYAQVAGIPAGKVCTYGKIAELAGYPKASREVGLAMSRVPSGTNLPCHRVVNKNGTLAPDYAFGGKEQQRKLLQKEGVAFHGDGSIDMQKHLWPDDSPVEQLSFG